MNDLERRALLGDRQAQEECTRQGIVLPCPFCGGAAFVKTLKQDYGFSGTSVTCLWCRARIYQLDKRVVITEEEAHNVPVENHKYLAIKQWNTRTSPQIGRCKDCANWYKQHCASGPCATEPTGADFFCGNFKQKEDK